jgi:Icc-related predicted phosphoesterase
VKILTVSDQVIERVQTLASNGAFRDVELIIGCGDLPYNYLEYLVTMINATMFYVPGNHDPEYDPRIKETRAEGGSNLDLKLARHQDFLIAGFGGSIRYRPDSVNQYTQSEASQRALRLLPGLLWNRLRYGRALDILISHSPPFGIHDENTTAHQGLHALNWLLRVARPRYHFHGHYHFYRNNIAESQTNNGLTKIMNIYPYKLIDVSP